MKQFEAGVVREASAPSLERIAYNLTAPFRGYGMERIPGLRWLYRRAYGAMTPHGIHEIHLRNSRLVADFSDMSIVPSLRLTSKYEATYSDALDCLVRPSQTVIDVGAHIGYHAVRFAQNVGPDGRVVAYEPEELLSSLLRTNVVRNGVGGWTATERIAVGAANGRGQLWHNGDNSGGASLSADCVDGITGSEEVEIVTLDYHLSEELDLPGPIDLIKVDVQGYESRVIGGAAKILERDHPTIGFEYNPQQLLDSGVEPSTLLSWLSEADYVLHVANEYDHSVGVLGAAAIHDWCVGEKPDGSGGFVNIVAVHPSREIWCS